MTLVDAVVVKKTAPLRVAEAVGNASGFGSENLQPVFSELYPRVLAHLREAGAAPGLCVAWYEMDPVGGVLVHAGFGLEDRLVRAGDGVRVTELPVIDVASVVYHGPMDDVGPTYEALMRWIDASGYRAIGSSRELYHEMCGPGGDASGNVIELQMPIAR